MTNELEDAARGLIGLFFGGILLMVMSSNISTHIGTNLAHWGILFVVAATLLGIILIGGIVSSIVEDL